MAVDVYVNRTRRKHRGVAVSCRRQFGDGLARDRIGDAEAAAEILEVAADLVEKADHLRPGRDDVVKALPLADEAVGPLAGLDQRRVEGAGHVALRATPRWLAMNLSSMPGFTRKRTTL